MKTKTPATHRQAILTDRQRSPRAKGRTVADFERSSRHAGRSMAMAGDGAVTISANPVDAAVLVGAVRRALRSGARLESSA